MAAVRVWGWRSGIGRWQNTTETWRKNQELQVLVRHGGARGGQGGAWARIPERLSEAGRSRGAADSWEVRWVLVLLNWGVYQKFNRRCLVSNEAIGPHFHLPSCGFSEKLSDSFSTPTGVSLAEVGSNLPVFLFISCWPRDFLQLTPPSRTHFPKPKKEKLDKLDWFLKTV